MNDKSGDNTDQNGGWYPILGTLFRVKPKMTKWLFRKKSILFRKISYFLEK